MSAACDALAAQASAGAAAALRAVDCLAGETTASAFGRLFGSQGALAPALTIVLTLYIAFFAISLLTGRSALGISALTPRMLTLGLVLTFATSWVAYQGVVWTLATGAPDQIAGILMGVPGGTGGTATQIFADRIDLVFGAIAQIAQNTSGGGATGAAQAASAGSFTPGNLMWLSALLLLLGTVGVLVTARIALAVLLATGPVFVIFALFRGTRGLTAGWLRGVVLTAVTPLFVIVGGSITFELLVPVVSSLGGPLGVDPRASVALFLIAAVHVALMTMMIKVAGTIVAGWRVFGLSTAREERAARVAGTAAGYAVAETAAIPVQPAQTAGMRRAAAVLPGMPPLVESPAAGSAAPSTYSRTVRTVVTQGSAPAPSLPPLARQRARGIGSRFRTPPAAGSAATRN